MGKQRMVEEIKLPNNVKVSCEKNRNPGFNNHFCTVTFPENNKINFEITGEGFMKNARAEDNVFESSVPGHEGYFASLRNKKTDIFTALTNPGFGKTKLEVADYGTDKTLFEKTFGGK